MGKKTKKPGKGKEKTDRKTAKAEEKRARRESKKVSEEDDIDAILRNIQKEEAKKKEVHVEDNVPAPSPRSNCSLTINPLKETELILYGGELYNGNKTFVYGDLYFYDVEKNKWKLISSPNSPPPRSAHQTVAWKNNIYIFGGEFTSPNQERFHHYKDFWILDLNTNQWEQLNLKGCPSARSGHRMLLYKHKIIVFGGFYDTLRELRYFNDLYVFDLDQYKWQEIKPRPGCLWPSPRSGFQLFVSGDEIFLYGGYSKEVSFDRSAKEKEVSSDKNAKEKGIVHSDMWSLNPRTWEWNKVKKSGMPPGPRAGFSMCLHKKRAVLFGGVVDAELEGDVMMSLFLNELYGFQFDSNRWYPLELRKEKSIKEKVKDSKKSRDLPSSLKDSQDNLEICITNDDDESIQDYEETRVIQDGVLDVSNQISRTLSFDVVVPSKVSEVQGPSLSDDLQPCTSLETAKPCGRINSCMVSGKDMLYLYGGMMEVNDREITLDDLYCLNLSKLDEWKCIIPASETEWLEVSDGEDDTEDDESHSEGHSTEADEDDDDEDGEEDNGIEDTSESRLGVDDAVSILKDEGRHLRRKEKKARIEQIRVSLGLSDSQRTPIPGETLRDFYRRTSIYWQIAAHEHTQHTGKELRKDGFDLAISRFNDLKPLLDEMAILEAEQKAEEDEGAATSLSKRGNKKNKKNAQR